MAFFAMLQWAMLQSVRIAHPTNISTDFLDGFFALATIAIPLDCLAALCAIQYKFRTLQLINHAYRLLGDKRRTSELISNGVNAAKKENHLPGSDDADLDILSASCMSIFNNLRRLQVIIDNHTTSLYWMVTVACIFFGIILFLATILMSVFMTHRKWVSILTVASVGVMVIVFLVIELYHFVRDRRVYRVFTGPDVK